MPEIGARINPKTIKQIYVEGLDEEQDKEYLMDLAKDTDEMTEEDLARKRAAGDIISEPKRLTQEEVKKIVTGTPKQQETGIKTKKVKAVQELGGVRMVSEE